MDFPILDKLNVSYLLYWNDHQYLLKKRNYPRCGRGMDQFANGIDVLKNGHQMAQKKIRFPKNTY